MSASRLALVAALFALAACGGGAAKPGPDGLRPCVDVACSGACVGTSCDGEWVCDTTVACSALATTFCGCDGKTFTSNSCSGKAYAHKGPCGPGVSCDPAQVLCKSVAPTCPTGQVPSVDGSCWGECVPVSSCTCSATVKCPASALCGLPYGRCV